MNSGRYSVSMLAFWSGFAILMTPSKSFATDSSSSSTSEESTVRSDTKILKDAAKDELREQTTGRVADYFTETELGTKIRDKATGKGKKKQTKLPCIAIRAGANVAISTKGQACAAITGPYGKDIKKLQEDTATCLPPETSQELGKYCPETKGGAGIEISSDDLDALAGTPPSKKQSSSKELAEFDALK